MSTCKESPSATDTVKNFIVALRHLDFAQSEEFISSNTKNVFIAFKSQLQSAPDFETDFTLKPSTADIIKDHNLDSISEVLSANNAVVYSKDKAQKVLLEKVNGTWKIVCTEAFLLNIHNKKKLTQVSSLIQEITNTYCRREYFLNKIIDTSVAPSANKIRRKQNELNNFVGDKPVIILGSDGQNDETSPIYCYTSVDSQKFSRFVQLENEITDLFFKQYFRRGIRIAASLYEAILTEEILIEDQKETINALLLVNSGGFGRKLAFKPLPLNAHLQEIIREARNRNAPQVNF